MKQRLLLVLVLGASSGAFAGEKPMTPKGSRSPAATTQAVAIAQVPDDGIVYRIVDPDAPYTCYVIRMTPHGGVSIWCDKTK